MQTSIHSLQLEYLSSSSIVNSIALLELPHAGNTVAPDLRGGAAALLLALFAGGESRIGGAEIVERGYEKLEAKLRPLGANIKIE